MESAEGEGGEELGAVFLWKIIKFQRVCWSTVLLGLTLFYYTLKIVYKV